MVSADRPENLTKDQAVNEDLGVTVLDASSATTNGTLAPGQSTTFGLQGKPAPHLQKRGAGYFFAQQTLHGGKQTDEPNPWR